MKKVILFATVAAAISFTSCKKAEHECECSSTYSFAGSTTDAVVTTETYKDVTKKHAKSLCYSSSTTNEVGGVTTKTCELKD